MMRSAIDRPANHQLTGLFVCKAMYFCTTISPGFAKQIVSNFLQIFCLNLVHFYNPHLRNAFLRNKRAQRWLEVNVEIPKVVFHFSCASFHKNTALKVELLVNVVLTNNSTYATIKIGG